MSRYHVADDREQEILRRNGMNPGEYAVMGSGEDWLRVLCYKSRDVILLNQGDRRWPDGIQ